MGGLMGGQPSIPDPAPPAAPPDREDPAVEEARRKQQLRASKERGRQANLLTGTEGVDTGEANIRRATLLGE